MKGPQGASVISSPVMVTRVTSSEGRSLGGRDLNSIHRGGAAPTPSTCIFLDCVKPTDNGHQNRLEPTPGPLSDWGRELLETGWPMASEGHSWTPPTHASAELPWSTRLLQLPTPSHTHPSQVCSCDSREERNADKAQGVRLETATAGGGGGVLTHRQDLTGSS